MIITLGEGANDKRALGGKAANLSLMKRLNFNVPPGFVVTSDEFERHRHILSNWKQSGESIDQAQMSALLSSIDQDLIEQIRAAMPNLEMPVAVRSSSVLEDSNSLAYAGQFETFLNVS